MSHRTTFFLLGFILMLSSACTNIKMDVFPKNKPVLYEEQIIGRNYQTRNYTMATIQDCVIIPPAKNTHSRSQKTVDEQDHSANQERD